MKEYIIIDSEGYRVERVRADDSLPIADFDAATWIQISDEEVDKIIKDATLENNYQRYVDNAWVPNLVTEIELRTEIVKLLASCDYTQLADCTYTDAKVAKWATYRQALRDLPSGYKPVANPTYPTVPSA